MIAILCRLLQDNSPNHKLGGNMSPVQTNDDKIKLIKSLREDGSGMLVPEKLAGVIESITLTETSYFANTVIEGFVFAFQVKTSIDSTKQFRGNGMGLGTAGAGTTWGTVYTDNLTKLYTATSRFELRSAPGYCGVLYYDANLNLLGYFSGGGLTLITGIFAGEGFWY